MASQRHMRHMRMLGNHESVNVLLNPEMNQQVKSKKTQTLGYRGLMEQNLKNHDYHHAFLYGEKLFSLNPNIEKLYETLIFIAAKTKNWNQLSKVMKVLPLIVLCFLD